ERGGLGGDALLIGLRFGHGGSALRFGALDSDVALGFGCCNFSVALDPRDVRATHIGDVLVLVANFLDGEAHDFESHLGHVTGASAAHAVTDHFRFLDDLLDGELADDAAEMAFHDQANEPFELLGPLGQELFGGGADRHGIGLHLELGDGFDGHRNALVGVHTLLRRDVKGHQLERELTAVLEHRQNDRSAAFDNASAAQAVNYKRFVRTRFAQQAGERHHGNEDD